MASPVDIWAEFPREVIEQVAAAPWTDREHGVRLPARGHDFCPLGYALHLHRPGLASHTPVAPSVANALYPDQAPLGWSERSDRWERAWESAREFIAIADLRQWTYGGAMGIGAVHAVLADALARMPAPQG